MKIITFTVFFLFTSLPVYAGLHVNTISGAPSGSYIEEQQCDGCPHNNNTSLSENDFSHLPQIEIKKSFLSTCTQVITLKKSSLKKVTECQEKYEILNGICNVTFTNTLGGSIEPRLAYLMTLLLSNISLECL